MNIAAKSSLQRNAYCLTCLDVILDENTFAKYAVTLSPINTTYPSICKRMKERNTLNVKYAINLFRHVKFPSNIKEYILENVRLPAVIVQRVLYQKSVCRNIIALIQEKSHTNAQFVITASHKGEHSHDI